MARSVPPERLEQLIECASGVFIAQGYRRTQMADIARALNVAKGTLYLYVESKEALFDLVARVAAGDRSCLRGARLPIRAPKRGATLRYAREQLVARRRLPKLEAALVTDSVDDPRSELDGILRELFAMLRDNRVGIKLLDSAARDEPELADVWFRSGREGLLALLDAYLANRTRSGALRPVADVALAARLMLETLVFWSVHRHWDPHPQTYGEDNAENVVVQFLSGGLLPLGGRRKE